MLRVRFPNGYTVTYNAASKVSTWNNQRILNDRFDKWVAMIPPEAIVECATPCTIRKPHEAEDLDNAIRVVHEQLSDRPHLNGQGWRLAEIKRDLRDFDARVGDWR